MSKVRVEYKKNSGFCMDIAKAAVPVKYVLPIIYATLKVVCENILMISQCGLTAAIIARHA